MLDTIIKREFKKKNKILIQSSFFSAEKRVKPTPFDSSHHMSNPFLFIAKK